MGYAPRFHQAIDLAVVRNCFAIESRLSPVLTTYAVNDGAGLGVGRTKLGSAGVGLAVAIADVGAPGDAVAVALGPSSPGISRTPAINATTITTRAADSHGESSTERLRAERGTGGVIVGV